MVPQRGIVSKCLNNWQHSPPLIKTRTLFLSIMCPVITENPCHNEVCKEQVFKQLWFGVYTITCVRCRVLNGYLGIFKEMPSSIPRITAGKVCKLQFVWTCFMDFNSCPYHRSITGEEEKVYKKLRRYQVSLSEIKGGKS